MKVTFVNIFNPYPHKWKTFRLKHWDGKRVIIRHHYGKIYGRQLDRDLNFVCWLVNYRGKSVRLSDPNFRPSFLPK